MGMLLHRHWLEQEEARLKAEEEAKAKAKEKSAEEPPVTEKKRGRPKKGE